MPYFKRDQVAEVDVLNGWFWAARRDALNQVGLLDETFFMYGEDIDWCIRFRQAAGKLSTIPWPNQFIMVERVLRRRRCDST